MKLFILREKLAVFIIVASSFFLLPLSCYSKEKVLETREQIRSYQTVKYATTDTKLVMDSIIESLKAREYILDYQSDEFVYVTAHKNKKVRDVSKPLLAFYSMKIVWDVVRAVITYGITSYSLVGDYLLIKLEFKDKDLDTLTAVNINTVGKETIVRANISEIMVGKRDGLFIGKQNRLKTIQIRDESTYKAFFYRLNKDLEAKNIKRIAG